MQKSFCGTVVHLATFKNEREGNREAQLTSELSVLTETGFLRWKERNPLAINLLLLLPAQVLLTLQIRAGYVSTIQTVDVSDNTAVCKLQTYPKVTMVTGTIS